MLKKKPLTSKNTKNKKFTLYLWNDTPVAEVATYKDWTKKKETDAVRTKWATVKDIDLLKPELISLFPTKEAEINAIRGLYHRESKFGSAQDQIMYYINRFKN